MDTFTVAEFSAAMGMVIDKALAHPVLITRHKRPVVVMLNVDEYERLVKPAETEAKGT